MSDGRGCECFERQDGVEVVCDLCWQAWQDEAIEQEREERATTQKSFFLRELKRPTRRDEDDEL